jgi:hypothetical protein
LVIGRGLWSGWLDTGRPAGASARGRTRAALGVPRDAVRFAAFGKITAEKRIDAILRAFDAVARRRSSRICPDTSPRTTRRPRAQSSPRSVFQSSDFRVQI